MTLIPPRELHRRRAQRVRGLLQDLWGDDLPGGPDPELTVLIDAVAGDDHMGSQDGYVVQSDRLTYDALALLLQRSSTPSVAALALPRALLSRVFATAGTWRDPGSALVRAGHPAVVGADAGADRHDREPGRTPRARALPDTSTGTWRLDPEQQFLSWDETCAGLLQRPDAPRRASLVEELEVWTHPADRERVVDSFEDCLRGTSPHRVRFRTLRPGGGFASLVATGQQVVDDDGAVHIVGVLRPSAAPGPAAAAADPTDVPQVPAAAPDGPGRP